MLRNSTNIPDKLVAAIVAFVIPPDTLDGVSEIVVKNKQRGKIRGQWGWYFSSDKKVVIIVPRKISARYTFTKKYSKRKLSIGSRAEFLVAVLAHELRHAWQFKHWAEPSGFTWKLEYNQMGKWAREVDAEIYEADTLLKWQSIMQVKAANTQL